MSIETKSELFERELQKLYHAEVEILDLHKELAEAASAPAVIDLFVDHREDTVAQITRIEEIFALVDLPAVERGSPIMEGLIAEKDELISDINAGELRDLEVIGVGTINEQIELVLLDRLLRLADDLDHAGQITARLDSNRHEAERALDRLEALLESDRT